MTTAQYPWLDAYLRQKPGAVRDYKIEWQWQRYRVGEKLFAALMQPGEQYDAAYAGKLLLNLKCAPAMAELFRAEYPEILPGFYSDKRCWNSVDLGGKLPAEVLKDLIDASYQLVFEKLSKKRRQEILEAVAT